MEDLTMAEEKAWELYLQGKIEAAKQLASTELFQTQDLEIKKDMQAILAWCAYRRKEYDTALAEIAGAGDNQRARECHVYILAYAKDYADDKKLSELVANMANNINAANALVIRARALESTVSHEQVWNMAESFAEKADVANHDVSLANLLHNSARFFLDKARTRRDLKFALGLIEVALAHYGDTSNWHHRAAIHLYKSIALEKLTAIPAAFEAAATSLRFWQIQCELEKDTKPFNEKLAASSSRVIELAPKLVEFAKRVRA